MAEFDRTLSDFNKIQFNDFTFEDACLQEAKRSYVKQLVTLPNLPEHVQYSSNPVI